MSFLNYHHLRYFLAIAQEGNLTRAAQHLSISPSALSIQLQQLEDSLGHPLFLRYKKRLILTDAGHLTLEYAENIFRIGEELFDTLKNRAPKEKKVLRIGSVTTLSRNFQLDFIQPLFKKKNLDLVLRTGSLGELLTMLHAHTIDLVLSNLPVPSDSKQGLKNHLIDEQAVILVSKKMDKEFQFPESLKENEIVLPSLESNIRIGFDLLMSQYGIRPKIRAEVSDMAMLRLVALHSKAITLVPKVVVKEELKNKSLFELGAIAQIKESFYAITPSRHVPNSLVEELIELLLEKKTKK